MRVLKQRLKRSALFRKTMMTIVILAIYSLGRNIPLPHLVVTNKKMGDLFQLSSVATGGDIAGDSVFSLGLSPWMSAVIVLGLFAMNKKSAFSRKSEREQSFWQLLFTLVLTTLQGLVKILGSDFDTPALSAKVAALIIMIGATFFLIWLASMNVQFGIGGVGAIFMINIIVGNARLIIPEFSHLTNSPHLFWLAIIGCLLTVFIIIWCSVVFERSEYRMPLKRVMITNEYSDEVYLPIKAGSAGAMPIMFGMSLVTLPQYMFQALYTIWPKNQILGWLASHFTTTDVVGVIAYILALFGLSLAFTYVNVNPEDVSDNLQKTGDYITGIAYGEATKKYITQKMWSVGIVGSIYLTIFAGCPLFLGIIYPRLQSLVLLPGNLMLNTTFVLVIIDQIRILRLATSYDKLLD